VPAGLLCPRAEKSALLKQNTATAPFLTTDCTDFADSSNGKVCR